MTCDLKLPINARCRASIPRWRVSALLLTTVLLLPATHAWSDGAPNAVQHLAVGVCATCHGARGISNLPKIPVLAGQSEAYLTAQLHAFKTQTRGDADAIGYMWGMAADLTDEQILNLSHYYATAAAPAQTHASSRQTVMAQITLGHDIYTQGIVERGVPACRACHGPEAHGLGDFPRLAGQHAAYITKQLLAFQNTTRDVAVMHAVTTTLQRAEMTAVATYLQSLP